MRLQSLVLLVTIGLIISRAVNTLHLHHKRVTTMRRRAVVGGCGVSGTSRRSGLAGTGVLTSAAQRRSVARALWLIVYPHSYLRAWKSVGMARDALAVHGRDLPDLWPRGAERCVLRPLRLAACR
jgi:hypothetical protein